jgi:hypothetical protein
MHTRTWVAALAAVSLLPLTACKQESTPADTGSTTATAATGIDGTWKADLASVKVEAKPNELLLQNGQYTCKTCIPSYTVAADGAFHPVKRPYSDMTSVKVDDDHSVTITAKKGDTVVGSTHYTVSPDGKTLTSQFTDSSVPNAKPVTGQSTLTRVGDAPAGAHAVSGQWQVAAYNNMSDEGLVVTFKTEGDMLHLSTPGGVSYDAKIGGPAVPIKGDIGGTMAQVTKSGDSWVETDTRDGKTVSVTTFSLTPDGKLHAVSEDPRDGSKTTYDATRS